MQQVTNLQKLKKISISATDISSQFWCERQMELNYLHGGVKTYAMKKGTQIHAAMQVEVYTFLKATPKSYADSLYKAAYENYLGLKSLKESGICREFRIYGSVNGYRIAGKIDEIRMVGGKVVISEQKTVGQNKALSEATTRPHQVQIMLYKKLLDDIRQGRYTYQNFSNSYGISKMVLSDDFKLELEESGIDDMSIEHAFAKMFEEICTLPEMSDQLEIHYINRNTKEEVALISVAYTDNALEKHLMHAMKYWNGERESQPVIEQEKWKCNFCAFFGKQCTVWYNK